MYRFSAEEGLTYNDRPVPHLLLLEFPQSGNQIVLDVLMHFFRDEADAESKAYALYTRLKPKLVTRFIQTDWQMTEDELAELVTLVLCEMKERVNGRSDLHYVSGQRFLRDAHGSRIN